MTDNEIIKGLGCCNKEEPCGECPLFKTSYPLCVLNLNAEAYNLINRQKAEIEAITEKFNCQQTVYSDLSKIIKEQADELKTAKSEAIREFAEKLKDVFVTIDGVFECSEIEEHIDNFVKEMVGEDK